MKSNWMLAEKSPSPTLQDPTRSAWETADTAAAEKSPITTEGVLRNCVLLAGFAPAWEVNVELDVRLKELKDSAWLLMTRLVDRTNGWEARPFNSRCRVRGGVSPPSTTGFAVAWSMLLDVADRCVRIFMVQLHAQIVHSGEHVLSNCRIVTYSP